MDLGLPDLDGVEVITRIRAWSNAPIIVISARSEDADKISALDAGADDYLTKPFSVEELLARLRATQRRLAAMAEAAAPAASVFVNGGLRIDYAAGCVYLQGAELHLTPIEYKLLCLLAQNVGKVLTHTYITRKIWGNSRKAILHPCACLWPPCAKSWKRAAAHSIFKRISVWDTACCAWSP